MRWQEIDNAPKDGRRLLLTIKLGDKKHVVIGGWDGDWSGRTWVYDSPRIPAGLVPLAWMPLPETWDGVFSV